MKKLLSILFCILLSLGFIACDISIDNFSNDESNSQDTNSCIHQYSSATCTEPQKCNICGETQGSALGHTSSTSTCTRCGLSFSKWEKRYYIDEFNNPTSNAFIAPSETLSGVFSNSATTNSTLSAYVRVDDENCQIMLWEYGSYLVKAYTTTNYNVTILLRDGTKKYFTGTMYKNGMTIKFNNYNSIITLLKTIDGVLKFYLQEDSDYDNSTYLFELDTSGFKDLYEKTFN